MKRAVIFSMICGLVLAGFPGGSLKAALPELLSQQDKAPIAALSEGTQALLATASRTTVEDNRSLLSYLESQNTSLLGQVAGDKIVVYESVGIGGPIYGHGYHGGYGPHYGTGVVFFPVGLVFTVILLTVLLVSVGG